MLDRTDAFRALRAGVEQVAALQRDLNALLPDYLAANVEPGFIKDGVLALFAAHNALAARLRHIEPRLLADLQQRGWAVDSLRIRVRPQPVKDAPPPKQARMSAAGAWRFRISRNRSRRRHCRKRSRGWRRVIRRAGKK